ncbi:glycogen/starch/alpha-glucan phosphorylase GlgP [Gottschalkia purinilytica]|uniref:Alpha-1,4 glucan phosphorylase n=1 Tax=Gottschalkia purinilytica TaxID=1503 RepID=A0A0L0W8Z5_GOTPU|nr:glycogen/starch/alpha-glucan phosphorylase [Gottschalkia purinilytica]KNF07926.1 glycogen/starch/alpha-glucan phosphorylase GlgP [Gottschalkia purinilytica]
MLKDKEKFKEMFLDRIQTIYGVTIEEASVTDKYMALSSLIRDYIYRNWVHTHREYDKKAERQVYYFSVEFLKGKPLGNNLLNLGLKDVCKEALDDLGIDLESIENIENDVGLGNGGLGRLGACFLESMASLGIPCHGCTIRYKYGLFKQKIIDGYQVEVLDNWLRNGNPWEVRKTDKSVEVKFKGKVRVNNKNGKMAFIHEDYESILAVPNDMPIIGYRNNTVNTLRTFSAEPKRTELDFTLLSREEVQKYIEYKHSVESISEILYPDDHNYEGKVLRLKQQYFLVSAGLQTIIRRFKKKGGMMKNFHEKVAIHINDTHPTLAIPELMRILIDEEDIEWDEAWYITTNAISYTNHTILPEALEKWNVDMFKGLLPRIYMIVHEINERFCKELWNRYPEDWDRIRNMAIINNNYINMAHLAVVGSYSVNGVAKVHTDILKNQVMKNFYDFSPYKFNNKTNGITHRTWLLKANPKLSNLITDAIGDKWIKEPSSLIKLTSYSQDSSFKENLFKVKKHNKQILADLIKREYNINIDLDSIVDVQVKRIHEYKRQILNVFNILNMYYTLKDNPDLDIPSRTFIFGGKAAPGYYMAKEIIKLINSVSYVINKDKIIKDKLKVIFLENYRVSLAERVFPASDVSEQISTASKEASGTGNMKFMINGSITMGTLDGANIEIRDAVGDDNFFNFGLTVDEVLSYYRNGGYNSWDVYNSDYRVKRILDSLIDGTLFGEKDKFRMIYESLLNNNDQYFVLKDFDDYVKTQVKLQERYKNKYKWLEMCTENIANAGKFSSDRTVKEYAKHIWKVKEVQVEK